jgi:aspartyl-tRNA synthetase (EC 6.1.1.12)
MRRLGYGIRDRPCVQGRAIKYHKACTEFTSVDMEMAWIESHEDIMKFEEEWIVHVMGRVKEEHGDEIKTCTE